MERRLIPGHSRAVVVGIVLACVMAGCAVVDPTERLGDRLVDIYEDERLQDLSGG